MGGGHCHSTVLGSQGTGRRWILLNKDIWDINQNITYQFFSDRISNTGTFSTILAWAETFKTGVGV